MMSPLQRFNPFYQLFRVVFADPVKAQIELEDAILDAIDARKESQRKWDIRYIELARLVASWSKDPSTQTGAVIVRPDNSVASIGYNGFPRGIQDTPERYEDREVKYSYIVHCEMNAVLSAHHNVIGNTLYTWPFLSCDRCAVHMIQAGITRVVAPSCPPDKIDRWEPILTESKSRFEEAGVEWVEIPHGEFEEIK